MIDKISIRNRKNGGNRDGKEIRKQQNEQRNNAGSISNNYSNADQVNKETGAIKTDAGYEITGKLDDYIGKTTPGEGDTPTQPLKLAKDVLTTNPDAEDETSKSPYVMYNEMLCRVLYNDETHGLQIITYESVEDVALGDNDETVSASDFSYSGPMEVTTSFLKTMASYNSSIEKLDNIAKSYLDNNGIALNARCVGSRSDFSGEKAMWYYGFDKYSYIKKNGFDGLFRVDSHYINEEYGYLDSSVTRLHREDTDQIRLLGLFDEQDKKTIWIADRAFHDQESSYGPSVGIRHMVGNNAGTYWQFSTVSKDGSGFQGVSLTAGFKPVFLLSSGAMVSSGDGSKENPYKIK